MDDRRFQFGLLGIMEYKEIFPGMQKPPEHICKNFSAGIFPERVHNFYQKSQWSFYSQNVKGLAYLTLVFSSGAT